MLRWPPAVATVAVFVAGSGTASAQIASSLNRTGSGARAAGMANAFVAVSDDGTAASWNPAGLSQLRKPEFSLVYTVGYRGLGLDGMRSPDGRVAYSNRQFGYVNSSPDFASAALPFTVARKPVTVQLGWQRIYHLGGSASGEVTRTLLEDPSTMTRLFVGNESGGNVDRGSLSAAVKPTGRMALGGSLNVFRGAWNDRLTYVEPSATASDFAEIRSDNRIRGTNLTVGLLFTYPHVNVGLVHNSAFWSSFGYHHEQDSNLQPPRSFDGGPQARFRLPRSIAAGVAWRPGPRWTLAADLTHDQWTDSLVKGFPGQTAQVNFFDGLPPEFSTTRDTTSLNVGGERLFLREGSVLPLRVGFAWEPQGAMDAVTRDPADYFMVAVGGGYNTNSLKFDAALQYRWGTIRASDIVRVETALVGGLVRDAFGQARSSEWRLKLSAIYRIPDTEKLRGLVRKIFG